ncbi:MAG: hypothetical protein KAQ63_01135 [Candidatus Moranbacteria bacterium]|nr:hypothetical protein [Candidatus Moranbacteria bacterium]
MNKNTSILLSLILIFLASYLLYWKGELGLEEAAKKFTVLAFENTSLSCDSESLEFFIENNLKEETSFQVSTISNDVTLENFEILIPAQSQKSVQPKPKTIETLCAHSQQIKYQITVENKVGQRSIYKLITP